MPDKPNILLIAIDSIRADHMSCYGYDRLTTAHIDRFAQSGALFENTFSPHIPTTPAYASMLTGLDCFGTQVVALRHQGPLRAEAPTAAEIFREFGYNTTSVGFQGNPSSRGFDTYIEFAGWGSYAMGRSPKAQRLNEVTMPELERLTARLTSPGSSCCATWIRTRLTCRPNPTSACFTTGNEMDPGQPFDGPGAQLQALLRLFSNPGCRRGSPTKITSSPNTMAPSPTWTPAYNRFSRALEEMGELDNTIIALNGDHGETLYDHELWFDHHGIFDNVLHVPLIIRYPDKVPQNVRISGYNQHKDLLPTLLDLAGLSQPAADAGYQFDGESLMSMVSGDVTSFDSEFYISECTWMRKHGWRTPGLEANDRPRAGLPLPSRQIELLQLWSKIPNEDNNLADERPDVVEVAARPHGGLDRQTRS